MTAKKVRATWEATTPLIVTQPSTPPPAAPSISNEVLFKQNIKDIHFAFNKSNTLADRQASMSADATFLALHPNFNITIEGHCNERGSTEYKIALGDRRANTGKTPGGLVGSKLGAAILCFRSSGPLHCCGRE
ncbi:MAG: hypothetical protein WB762_03440 [Candidatus Sulfotelmatobacter sp.]